MTENQSVYDALIAEATPAPKPTYEQLGEQLDTYKAEIDRLTAEVSRLENSRVEVYNTLTRERRDRRDNLTDLKSYLIENKDNLDIQDIANIFGIELDVTVSVTATVRHTFSVRMSLEDYSNFSADDIEFDISSSAYGNVITEDHDYSVDDWDVSDPE